MWAWTGVRHNVDLDPIEKDLIHEQVHFLVQGFLTGSILESPNQGLKIIFSMPFGHHSVCLMQDRNSEHFENGTSRRSSISILVRLSPL